MKIGIPKEIKSDERRVAFFPDAVRALAKAGLRVLVERGAGAGSGFTDQEYPQAGATIAAPHAEIFGARELVVKGKEPTYRNRGQMSTPVLESALKLT